MRACTWGERGREGGRRRESGKSWRWRRIKRDGGREGRERQSEWKLEMEKAKERWGGRGSHREGVRDGERAGWGGGGG